MKVLRDNFNILVSEEEFLLEVGEENNENAGSNLEIDEDDLRKERMQVVRKVRDHYKESDADIILPFTQPASLASMNEACSSNLRMKVKTPKCPPKIVSCGQSTKQQKVAQDIKYNAEHPSMVNLSVAGVEVSSLSCNDLEESSNANWPAVNHLVYPIHSQCISVNNQSQMIKDLLTEAILLTVGLTIFQDGFATSNVQVTHSYTSITLVGAKQELPKKLYCFK
ncbi:hypothetical protein DFH05DRAFT_1527291 [Lentinula detonsa]|uniref:Uncharacterized protein n=1 Tax=Lentinula detonsa TaxID=2804962 RepID=A0A9W8NX88_9AGAR|nr:hypothetical protein DFH05DRAFT_1527291 [Lentinula detonsa]